MKQKVLVILAISFCWAVLSCNSGSERSATNAKEHIADTVQPIDISHVKTVLPQAGNVELIETHCVPCHSLRYIEMQPELTHKAWEKTVDKMITVFGAPIRDSVTRHDIIEYLYAIKGKKG